MCRRARRRRPHDYGRAFPRLLRPVGSRVRRGQSIEEASGGRLACGPTAEGREQRGVLSQIVFGAALGLLAGLLDVLISRGLVRRPQPAPRDRRAERAAVLDALASGCRTAEDVADETGLTRLAVDDALAGLAGAGLVGVSAGRVSEVGRGRDVRRYRVVGLAPLTAAGRARVDRELAEAARRARERTWRRRGSFPRLEN